MDRTKNVSREAATTDVTAAAASRLEFQGPFILRVNTRSYVLPSLRDSKLCNLKEAEVRITFCLLPSRQPHLEQIRRIGYPPASPASSAITN
jgi:hypothetical protein